MKRIMKTTVAWLLILCTLLTVCGVLSACKKDPKPTPSPTPTPPPPAEPGPEQIVACAHTVTTLKNARATSCARAGYTGDVVCTACGEVITQGTVVPALSHTLGEASVTKLPTCIETGISTRTCRGCGYTFSEPISVVAHDDIYHDWADGSSHRHTCSTCTLAEDEAHEPVDAGTYHEASCTEPAYIEHVCALCAGVYKVYSDTDLELGHSWGEWVLVEATCVSVGSKSRTCDACGETESSEIPVASAAHTYLEVFRVKATCSATGSITYECEDCGTTKEDPIAINPHAHTLGEAVTSGSWTTQECVDCDYEVKKFTAAPESAKAEVSAADIDTNRTFEVATKDASIQFPKEVVADMTSDASAAVEINAGVVDNKQELIDNAPNLTDAEKERLQNVDIFDFSVTVGGAPMENFGTENKVVVTIPYTLKEGEDPNGIEIWYVKDDGTIEKFEATYVDGFVTFETSHFSYYAVAYEETQEMKCKRGLHDWMSDSIEVVEASCTSFGYTVKECSTCHTRDFAITADKTGHSYGDPVEPTITCTQDGYTTKTCTDCGDMMYLTYHHALGHTVASVATCVDDSVCKHCNSVVTKAHGHNWGEWITVYEPTETQAGLRRKNCQKCGVIEDVKLAATGSVQEITFDSYEEMLEALFDAAFAFDNGKMSFTYEMDGDSVTMDVTVNKEGESYVALFDCALAGHSYRNDNGNRVEYDYVDTVKFLYRNGVMVLLQSSTSPYHPVDGNSIEAKVGIETLSQMPYQIMMQYAKEGFDQYMPKIEASFGDFAAILRIADVLAGDAVNAVLADMGTGFTLPKLADLYDKLQTLYTYTALKLGFATTLDFNTAIAVPTTHDLMAIISAYMTVTERADGGKDYVFNPDKVKNAVVAVLDWLEANETKTLDVFAYQLVGNQIKLYYPEVTDWQSFENKLRATFTGNMKVKDAINTAIGMLESKDICTLQEIYSIINSLAQNLGGQQNFDIEQMMAQSAEMTLDEMMAGAMGEGATVAAMFDMLHQYVTTQTLGDLVCREEGHYDQITQQWVVTDEITLSEMLDTLRAQWNSMDILADFALSLDAHGSVIAISIDHKLDFVMGSDRATVEKFAMTLTQDDSVVVNVPAEFAAISTHKVQASYDADGNMIITVPAGYQYTINVGGNGYVPMSELLTLDAALSAEMGYDVYVLDEDLWDNNMHVGEYILYNGRYYSCTRDHEYTDSQEIVIDKVTLAQLQSSYEAILPEAGEAASGVLKSDSSVSVYETVLNPIFKQNDVWYMAKSYDISYSSYWNADTQQYVEVAVYNVGESVVLADALSSIRLSNAGNNYHYYVTVQMGTEKIRAMHMYVSLDEAAWGNETLECFMYVDKNGDICLLKTKWQGGYGTERYVLGEAVDRLPDHDYKTVNGRRDDKDYGGGYDMIYKENFEVLDASGTPLDEFDWIVLYRYLPEYFIKINDTTYAELGYYYNNEKEDYGVKMPEGVYAAVNTQGMNMITLPDGNKMYQKGERVGVSSSIAEGKYDKVVYGYVQLHEDLYIEAACFYSGSTLLAVKYRSNYSEFAPESRRLDYSEFLNINDYLTVVDGTTYRISADFFKLMKKICSAGDSYWVDVQGTMSAGDYNYTLHTAVGVYHNPKPFSTLNSYGSYFYWPEYFGYGYEQSMVFKVTVGAKGTLTIMTQNGESVSVNYSAENRYPLDAIKPTKDELKSEETGLNIYSAVTDSGYGSDYLYQDGKYYQYNSYSVYNFTFHDKQAATIAADMMSDWELENFSYRYDCTFADGTGSTVTIPVYQAIIEFGGSNYYNYFGNVYLTVKDGKIWVLTGAREMGESVLEFEDMVLIGEYFDALAETLTYEWTGSNGNVWYNGGFVELKYDCYTVTEKDAQGNALITRSVNVYFLDVNGTKKYIKTKEWVGEHLVSGAEVPFVSGMIDEYHWENTYDNGTFEMAHVRRTELQYFVKLANVYYRYDGSFYTVDEQTFKNNMLVQDWFYGVLANGEWGYYNKLAFENGYAVLSEPIDNVVDGSSWNRVGITAEGYEVYECVYYHYGTGSVDDLVLQAERKADGTIFYYKKGQTVGYLKLQDGTYTRARKVYTADGSYRIECSDLGKATLTDYALNHNNVFAQYVQLDKHGSAVVISKAILEAIPESVRDSFRINIGNYIYLTYDQLAAWFELEGENYYQNGGFSTDNNNQGGGSGFVDREELNTVPMPKMG